MKRKNKDLPNLVLSRIEKGANESPMDLRRFLYKGGAALRANLVANAIRLAKIGPLQLERLEVMVRAHDFIDAKLVCGGSSSTARTQFRQFAIFVAWIDKNDYSLTMESIQADYIRWTDHLVFRRRVQNGLSRNSAYGMGRVVGQIIDSVLDRPMPVLELTRLKEAPARRLLQSSIADKQNLASSFDFGAFLQDICDGLPLGTIWGPQLVRIPLRNGKELLQGQTRPIAEPMLDERTPAQERKRLAKAEKRRLAFENDRSPRSRAPLINFRIISELLMFIGQTGMNLSEANSLELRKFSYASDIDGYKVRDYKERRRGEVLFEIFKEYRSHFERYLKWREALFINDTRLFPIIRNSGTREASRPWFGAVIQACETAGVVWQPPGSLRNTRVNWFLRRSGDEDMTAEMAQHSKQTLIRNYEDPSLQRSMGEFTRFWNKSDPTLSKVEPTVATAPGVCDGIPVAVSWKPLAATSPDCVHPSGCLWCEHHRDISSLDYVWALACFRHLKTLELSRYRPSTIMLPTEHPSSISISRLSEKLTSFRDSDATGDAWVHEALARVEEGNYHPVWSRLIEEVEGTE